MDTAIALTTLNPALFQFSSSNRTSVAPSSSDQSSMSPRQTEALLPTDLAPAGQGDNQQDVSGTKQEQSRLVDDMRQTAEKANAYMNQADTHLQFTVDNQTGHVVISVINSDTNQVIRQIPPEALSRFASRITQMKGLLFEASG
jgi:uncharacterized FlaG/YvyC family protein